MLQLDEVKYFKSSEQTITESVQLNFMALYFTFSITSLGTLYKLLYQELEISSTYLLVELINNN